MPPLKAMPVEAKIERQTIHAWLLSLAKAGIVTPNIRVTLEVEKLLRVLLEERKEKDPAAFAFALAGLLAKDEAAYQRVVEHFQDFFKAKFVLPWRSDGESKLKPWLSPKKVLLGLSLGPLIAAVIILVLGLPRQPPPIEPTDGGAQDAELDASLLLPNCIKAQRFNLAKPFILEQTQEAQTHSIVSNTSYPPRFDLVRGLAAFASLLLGFLAIRAFFAPRSFNTAEIDEHKRSLEEKRIALMGKDVKELGVRYRFESRPLLPHSDMDDSAGMLGRLTLAEPGIELNVDATIAQTIEEGGRIRPEFAPGCRPDPLVVLLDIEGRGHPFLRDMDVLLQRWRQGGVPLVRYDFSFRPTVFRRYGDGRQISLNDLAHRYEGARVLLISRLVFPEDTQMQMHWLKGRAFQCWPQRAFLDLDPRLKKDRSFTERATLGSMERYWHRFPCTPEGLLACASWLLSRGQKSQKPKETGLPSLKEASPALKEALKIWAAAATCVPDPEWGHLDSIREALPELREHLPDARYVQLLLQWLGEHEGYVQDASGIGPKLSMKKEAKQALLDALRQQDTKGIERRVRMLLIKQMKQANIKEKDNPLQYHRQKMKIAAHEGIIGIRSINEIKKEYENSPMANELFGLLQEEVSRQERTGLSIGMKTAWTPEKHGEITAWTTGRTGVQLRDIFRIGPWTRWQRIVGAVLGIVLVGMWGGWMIWWGKIEGKRLTRMEIPSLWKVRGDPSISWPDEENTDALADVAPMQFVKLPGGKFMMGSPETEVNRLDDEKEHAAEVLPFEIARYEVTQKQWTAVMGTKPFDCNFGCGDDYPAQNVSWGDAVQFMNKLTELENKTCLPGTEWTPCYEKQGEKWIRKKACTGYRLPTEAEWEYAARAGTKTAYSFGDDEKELCKYGNGADASAKRKHSEWSWALDGCDDSYADLAPVGKFKANLWGLYDMHGNVWEWVWDWYAPYPENAKAGYGGPETMTDGGRVLRGGSFSDGPGRLRSSNRLGDGPSFGYRDYGFRCVRGSPQP